MKIKLINSTHIIALLLIISQMSYGQTTPVYVVLFTHIEDNTPVGIIGTQESRQNYLRVRGKMIEMANLAKSYNIKWSIEPDWKILLAALMYEDAATMQSTNGKNFLRFLKEDMGAAIDPHSHESQGYNYTDVAHLLDSLGVGGSKIIGGHIWDPNLPQFQNWDRFRVPVKGTKYPWAVWRGEILMGSGTPNHVNDPLVSGVWRPKDKFTYFVDDPNGNITCVGKYKGDISSTKELINLYKNNIISSGCMLTSSYHITPTQITSDLIAIEDTILKPLKVLRDKGEVILTDFTSLIADWEIKFNAKGFIYDPSNSSGIEDEITASKSLYHCYPNPFENKINLQNESVNEQFVLINTIGRIIWSGKHIEQQDFSSLASGLYFLKVNDQNSNQVIKLIKQ